MENSWLLFRLLICYTIIHGCSSTIYSCDRRAACGCSANSVSVNRIVGGENATKAAWGWVASIAISGTYLCGGSILSNSWIVTTAHCVSGTLPSQITVYVGSILRWSGTQSRVAAEVIVHAEYNSATYTNDIALLRLASPLTMPDPDIAPICIPSVSSRTLSRAEWPSPGTAVVVVGWGLLTENGVPSLSLQQVTLQTVDRQASTCSSLIRNWQIQLCAGVAGGGKGACQGDSGGPLMMFTREKQWVLVGLVSNGYGCARAGYSTVYTRVAAYESWMKSKTNGSYPSVYIADVNGCQRFLPDRFVFILSIYLIPYSYRQR